MNIYDFLCLLFFSCLLPLWEYLILRMIGPLAVYLCATHSLETILRLVNFLINLPSNVHTLARLEDSRVAIVRRTKWMQTRQVSRAVCIHGSMISTVYPARSIMAPFNNSVTTTAPMPSWMLSLDSNVTAGVLVMR